MFLMMVPHKGLNVLFAVGESVREHPLDVGIRQAIVHMSPLAAMRDESSIPERTQLMAHGRLADVKGFDDVMHAYLPVMQQAENLQARRVREALQQPDGRRSNGFIWKCIFERCLWSTVAFQISGHGGGRSSAHLLSLTNARRPA